jgi:hypothetical protein
MTNFSPLFGYWEGVQLDPAIANSWGTPNSLNYTLIESTIAGVVQIDLTGLTTYTITKSNGASDQWKQSVIQFIGATPGACTVTMPNVNRGTGKVQNLTTGGNTVILTTGVGTTATLPYSPLATAIPAAGPTFNYFIDSSGNVTLPQIVSVGTGTNDNALAGTTGEYLQATGSASIPVGTRRDVATLSLSAGDWDVDGIVQFSSFSGGTASGDLQVWINTTSATTPSTPFTILSSPSATFGANTNLPAFTARVPAAAATTVYLSAFAGVPGTFTTATATGLIRARRPR